MKRGTKTYKSTCCYCGVGCGILIKTKPKGEIEVSGDPDHPVNRGMLCSKGMNLHHVVEDKSDRILHPQMRWSKHHPLQKTSWDNALERTASTFRSIIKKHGPDSVGFYISGQCLTEEYYLVNKLTKGYIGTNNIDTNSRLCMSSAVMGYKHTFGEDSVPIAYEDIEHADCFMIAGANPAWCHPILYRRIEKRKAQHPASKIIVIDPRRTQSCDLADLHLQLRPGTDIVLYHAIARELIRLKKIDATFVRKHTAGFEEYKKQVLSKTLKEAAFICDVSVADIQTAARYIGDAKGFITMWAMGLNQSVVGVYKNYALLNLSLMTGHVGKRGSGAFSLTGQPNAMGGREVGGMATLLAAHKDLANPTHRQEVADYWGVESISPKPGYTATELVTAIEKGKLKALWVICTNPVVSLPNVRNAEEVLKKVGFLVVQDCSTRSETVPLADVVLPAATWAEKEGTMTNSERRISYLSKATDPPGEAKPDAEIIWQFAQKMGYDGFNYNNTEEVFEEHARMTRGTNIDIGGLSYSRLQNEGTFQWPVPTAEHKGTPRLFTDLSFYTSHKKAVFNRPKFVLNNSELTSEKYPLVLNSGRVRDQWHTRTKTGKVYRLGTHIPNPYLEIHPKDAKERHLKEGDVAEVSSKRGSTRVAVRITSDTREGSVFMPIHWGKVAEEDFGRVNNLTTIIVDPISKEPDYKYCAVEVHKYQPSSKKICIIGAGSAAFRFIQTYRYSNTSHPIHVFSKEEDVFYNRVLLPEYVSGELLWQDLQKIRKGEGSDMNIHLHRSNPIASIDAKNQSVTDSHGVEHDYDILIMATGSKAFVPADAHLHLPGRFTMRERGDADRLKSFLEKKQITTRPHHVTIIGGGLLGLELAASLRKIGIDIRIVQKASRLMERQLDIMASRLLAEDVIEKGIDIDFDNEVDTIFGADDASLEITLKTGKQWTTDAVVFAIGTIPNVELARKAGLHCQRGIVVSNYMQSSDLKVYALGEIAEYEGTLYGTTAAAEQQADSLAKYLLGDMTSIYRGSVLMNILKFEDLDLCTLGTIDYPTDDTDYQEVVLIDQHKRFYKRCIVYQDRLIGAVLMGDKAEFAHFKSLIEDKLELSERREELLRGQSTGEPVLGALVCSCSQVGEGNLIQKIESGTEDFAELCSQTGAGLGCGSCKPEVKEILDRVLAEQEASVSS